MTSPTASSTHASDQPTDVVIVGAGLSGLTAAVTAARSGKAVRVLERLPRAGGLCGAFELDGHTFVRACNEFGGGVADALGALGVPCDFRRASSRVLLPGGATDLPPGPLDLPRFVRHAWGLAGAVRAGRRRESVTLYDAVSHRRSDPWVRSLVAFVSAASATPPDRIPLSELSAFVRAGYGWHRPVKVVGGPGALVEALVRTAERHRVRFDLGVAVDRIEREAPRHGAAAGLYRVVASSGEVVLARHVLTSAPRWDRFPSDAPHGLHYGTALFVMRGDPAFPGATTTLHYVPPAALETMVGFGRGHTAADFPFILASPLGPAPPSGRTLVAFFPTPQGTRDFSPEQRRAIRDHLVTAADRALPGFARGLASVRVVSPVEFESLHGVAPRSMERLPPPGWTKPDALDPETGVYHLGVSVGPPGADGAAAIFSGRVAGERVVRMA